VAAPSPAVGGRPLPVLSGRCVGGGSAVNFLMYTRAAASDYDGWAAPGWTTEELLPLLRKMETYQEEPGLPTHGYDGPLKVSHGGHLSDVAKQFLDVAAAYDKQRGSTADMNGLYECDAYGRWPKWIDKDTGKRSDPAHQYIYNQAGNTNLEILTGARVRRVLFEGDRATGVEYVVDDENKAVFASRLVVLSAGAFGSPAILERSGIGNAQLLEKLGVPVIVDLPGVGENYQDHHAMFVPYHGAEDTETLEGLLYGDPEEMARWQKVYDSEGGRGLMASNGIDAGIKARPTDVEREQMGPAFQEQWDTNFAQFSDRPVAAIGCMTMPFGIDPSLSARGKHFIAGCFSLYPISRGSTHITSAENVASAPNFLTGYLEDTGSDLAVLVWGYKRSRELARRLPAYRGELAAGHPVFPENSAARVGRTSGPVPMTDSDIEYTAEDEQAIEDWARRFVQTTWHSLGTCAMKARTAVGVVDFRLNVHGVKNLKVADLSIAPSNIGANTCSTAVLVGEKAAVIIGEEIGITLFD
ncbi:alcohol oxidase-like protein, partial [Schizophyllum fasciatum]